MVINNELSVHFDVDKIKLVVLGIEFSKNLKSKIVKSEIRNSVFNDMKMKLYIKVKYFGCVLDENLPDESLVLNVIHKVIQ